MEKRFEMVTCTIKMTLRSWLTLEPIYRKRCRRLSSGDVLYYGPRFLKEALAKKLNAVPYEGKEVIVF